MIELLNLPFPETVLDEEITLERINGIGGSDAGAILGVHAFKSSFELYLEKIGEKPPIEDKEIMFWGRILEDSVAQEFSRRTGKKIHRVNQSIVYPKFPWMRGRIDRKVEGEKTLLECKTTSAWMESVWEEEGIPLFYQAQIYHYMAITGYQKAYLPILFGGQIFKCYVLERNEKLIEQIILMEQDFWENHVLKRIPPEIDGSNSSVEALKSLFPESNGEIIDLDTDAEKLLQEYFEARKEEAAWKENKTLAENKIKLLMKDAEKANCNNWRISWKSTKPRITFDKKEFKSDHPDLYEDYINEGESYRRFLVKQLNDS